MVAHAEARDRDGVTAQAEACDCREIVVAAHAEARDPVAWAEAEAGGACDWVAGGSRGTRRRRQDLTHLRTERAAVFTQPPADDEHDDAQVFQFPECYYRTSD